MTPQPLTSRHPFIEGSKYVPDRKKDLQKIRTWLQSQPHLPQHISDEYIYLFLHAAFYNHDRTKHTLENYFTIRSTTPMLFENRDCYLPEMQKMLPMVYLARLPKTTPEGYKALLLSVRDADPTKLVFQDAAKGVCMLMDCAISEDGIHEGYVAIFDMKKVQIGHLARVNLPILKAMIYYLQDAQPGRLKAVHVLNTAPWVHHVIRIVLPLVRSEFVGLIKFHQGDRPEGFPLEMLPADYGGEAPSMDELDQQTKALVDKYADWLRETEQFKSDESKRVKKTPWWGLFGGSNQCNDKLDEKTIMEKIREKEREREAKLF